MPGERGGKCGSRSGFLGERRGSNVQKREKRPGGGNRRTCRGTWTSVLLPLASCLLSSLLLSGPSRWHRGHRAPFPHSPCPEGGPGGAPTRPGPAQGSSAGLAAASSDQALLTGLRASRSPAPRRRQRPSPPSANPSLPPNTPPNSPLASASCEKHLFHSGLREAPVSGVEIARSKRSSSKAKPSPYRSRL